LIVQVAFASQAVEAKVAMAPRPAGGEAIAPAMLAMVRMIGGAAFFQVFCALRRYRSRRVGRDASDNRDGGRLAVALTRSEHLRLAGLSVLGVALNQALFLLGLRWTSPFSVALLSAAIPVFAASLAVLFGKEQLRWRTVAGFAFALVGVWSLIGAGSLDRGAMLVAFNSLSYAAYVVLSRDVVLRIGALRTMAWVFSYGALLFAPVGLPVLLAHAEDVTPRGWAFVSYIVALPTIAAYALNAWALKRSSATLVTIYVYLQPLLAGLLAWVQLGTAISPRAWYAGAFILAGVTIVSSRSTAGLARFRSLQRGQSRW